MENVKEVGKHTPGPWRFTHDRAFEKPIRIREKFSIVPQGGPAIAFLPEGRIEIQKANSALIAAAPELLELVKLYRSCGTLGETMPMHKVSEMADKVIGKAEGSAI